MNKEKIISILKELHNISGFRISIHDANFEEIAAYPEDKLEFCTYVQKNSTLELEECKKCDRDVCRKVLQSGEAIIYKCRHNLVEAISPIYNFGVLTGFLMMGQVRVEGDGIDPMLFALAKLGKNDFEAREICAATPSIKDSMIKSYVNIMTICASYLTLSNAITSSKATVGQLTMRYVSENFTERITIKDICTAVGYSKSTVLSAFKKEFAITVNKRLNDLRLQRAKNMLENSDATINEIALACGFADQSYFSKVFSSQYGVTPTEYKKDKRI